jgi:hypothetical protein
MLYIHSQISTVNNHLGLPNTKTCIICAFWLFMSPFPLISTDNWGFNVFQCRNILEILPLFKSWSIFYIFSNGAKVAFEVINDVKTSQSEKLSSPSCATSIICLSSDVMSSIMALEQKMKSHAKLDEAHTNRVNSWHGYWLSWWRFSFGYPQSLHTNAQIIPQIRWQPLPSTLFPIH